MNTVLAAIDFSPVTRTVLANAIRLTRTLRGRLLLFHVVQPPVVVADFTPLVGEVLQFTTLIEKSARRHLRELRKRCTTLGVKVDVVCRNGFPASLIVEQAKASEAQYIVLGSHGHTALYDLVVGSTTSGVLKRAPCPVVVVPAAPAKRKGKKKR